MATRITVELSDDELHALEQASREGGFASPADALRAGIPRVARRAAELEAIAEAYRNAYQARPQEAEHSLQDRSQRGGGYHQKGSCSPKGRLGRGDRLSRGWPAGR